MKDEFSAQLQAAINGLSDPLREVFLMNSMSGHTYKEIAEILDLSVKAVEKRMTQALKFLKARLEIKV